MSIEKITSKIIGDAEETKRAVLAETREKADAVIEGAKAEAEALLKAEEAEGLELKEKTISRRKSVADIDCKKMVLQKKQELLEACFEKAADALIAMDEEDYIQFLVGLGKAAGETAGQLIFNEKDKAAVGQKVCDRLAEAVNGGDFQLADETRNIKGGFVMQVGKVYINNTVEALIAEHKEAMSGEVAAMLFD